MEKRIVYIECADRSNAYCLLQGTCKIWYVQGNGIVPSTYTAECSLTPAVCKVPVLCCVVLAKSPQDQLVVH